MLVSREEQRILNGSARARGTEYFVNTDHRSNESLIRGGIELFV